LFCISIPFPLVMTLQEALKSVCSPLKPVANHTLS
jgi:hypothetical protein